MITAIVEPYDFIDIKDLLIVHSDDRRTISEKIDQIDNVIRRTTRIVITANDTVLGNHYHDFQEDFTGIGAGELYTAPNKESGDIYIQNLPEMG